MLTARGVYTTPVHTVTLPYPHSSSTYTTVLFLEKATPTPTPHSHSGLSASSIGAIIGSILGTAVLLLLAYCCCFRRGDDEEDYDSDSGSQFGRRAPSPAQLPPQVVQTRETGRIFSRPSRNNAHDDTDADLAPATKEIQIPPTTVVHGSADRVKARGKEKVFTRPSGRRRHRAPMNEPRSHTRSRGPNIVNAAP